VPDPGERPFDFDEMRVSGARALDHGLPALPEELTPPTVVPLAYWKTPSFGAVVFLTLSTPESDSESPIGSWHGIYERIDEGWSAQGFTGIADWGGPVGPPGATDGLQGEAIRKGGWVTTLDPESGQGPHVSLVWGWHSPEVTQIVLVQGSATRNLPSGHYGAWIIGIESKDPWRIEAHDHSGRQLGFVDKDSWGTHR
jgi:hypothetical protein